MHTRFAVVAAVLGFWALPADAQQFDRRARDEPEVVIRAGGRVGTCDVVRWTPAGDHLLAAGDDKVVWGWPHSAGGLDTDPKNVRTLHWRSWRDQLGGIKAMAVSPDGNRVAVGGYGLKISSVAVIDRESGETAAITWPKTYEGGPNFDAVMAVAFDADGKRIAFGTADGSLWVWEPAKLVPPADGRTWNTPLRAGQFEVQKNKTGEPEYNLPRSVRFADANTLVGVSQHGQVLACDLRAKLTDDPDAAPPAGQTLFNVNDGVEKKFHTKFAEWSADGKWLAVGTTGNLALLRSADGKRVVPAPLEKEQFVRSLAIDATGKRIAIGVGRALDGSAPRFFVDGDDTILLLENAGEKLSAPRVIRHAGRAEAMAFHPTLDRLAVVGGDADEVKVLELANTEKPVSVVNGRGRRLFGVNLSEDGHVIGFTPVRRAASLDPNARADEPWTRFNLARFSTSRDANVKWVGAVREAGGWTIVPDAESRFVWYAERRRADGAAERIRLGLDRDLDQAPTCFTFVPTPAGRPPRVLVGHYYGCSLFEIDPARVRRNERTGLEELPRSKLFIGHGAEVNSVVADRKGEWFVTAASDHTVAGWSLADWKAQPALGGSFAVKDGKLVVTAVDVGSPAWEAGLTTGDVINGLAVDGKRIFDGRPNTRTPLGSPEVAARALENSQSGVELFFAWTAGTASRATPTRIKQRPLWKFFPAFDERGRMTDSVLWMWHGSYYYTASLHGDRMVGWHVNHPDVGGTPAFRSLERYKTVFLKPGAIARLIGTRSVAEALKEAADGNVVRRSFREFEPEPVDLAIGRAEVRGNSVAVALAVNGGGNNPDLQLDRVELWLNDYRVKDWDAKGKNALKEVVTIPASAFRAGDNQLTLLAMNPARGRAEAVRFIRNPASPATPRLHGLAVGVNDYSAHRKADLVGARSFGDLVRAGDDAAAFQKEVLTYRGKGRQFPEGDVALKLDAKADRKTLLASLAELRKRTDAGEVRPDDLLVVFFAGHGDLLTDAGKALPVKADGRGFAADSGRFVFCCPDYSPAKADATTLSGEELFDQLAGVNCRKLVLLDTCHAGGALETNLLRRCIPNGQGPVVIAACDESEKSFEDDKLRHGMFTYAVLEALGPRFRAADRGADGKLTAEELFGYVSGRVPELMKFYRPGNTQNPICFPQPDALPRVAMFTK